jgi:hypothetical protein
MKCWQVNLLLYYLYYITLKWGNKEIWRNVHGDAAAHPDREWRNSKTETKSSSNGSYVEQEVRFRLFDGSVFSDEGLNYFRD